MEQGYGSCRRSWGVAAVLALFVLCGLLEYWNAPGEDLASSYVGCRLFVTGDSAHLYSYDPVDFASVGPDDAWQEAADWGGYTEFLHPYVQTPLWAWSLQPLCHQPFTPFRHLFELAGLLAFAACLWLIARFWAPSLFSAPAMGAVVLCLWFSEPFRYAMALTQTHVLFLLLTVAALLLAERRRPGWAGLLLTAAAAVKITPAVLLLYWLVTSRRKAALSMVLWSAALALATWLTAPHLLRPFLGTLHRVSQVLLLSFNNQSFAAWCMDPFHPNETPYFHILTLPKLLKISSTIFLISLTIAGGLLDRARPLPIQNEQHPPLGAALALIAGTLFAPIAWTHYSILLLVPLMMIWHKIQDTRRWRLLPAGLLCIALNLRPLALNLSEGTTTPLTILRSEFYSACLCIALLVVLARLRVLAPPARGQRSA